MPVLGKKPLKAIREIVAEANKRTASGKDYNHLLSAIDCALPIRRSVKSARKRAKAKKESRNRVTRTLREFALVRCQGLCECGCGRPLNDGSYPSLAEMDHFHSGSDKRALECEECFRRWVESGDANKTAEAKERKEPKGETVHEALRAVVNRFSIENHSNTPDFILARFLQDALDVFASAVRKRSEWYGGRDSIGWQCPNCKPSIASPSHPIEGETPKKEPCQACIEREHGWIYPCEEHSEDYVAETPSVSKTQMSEGPLLELAIEALERIAMHKSGCETTDACAEEMIGIAWETYEKLVNRAPEPPPTPKRPVSEGEAKRDGGPDWDAIAHDLAQRCFGVFEWKERLKELESRYRLRALSTRAPESEGK